MNETCKALAKSPTNLETLSLVDHSIDVAAVAEELLSLPLLRARLAKLAGREITAIDRDRIGFLIGLHDAGKANTGFQRRIRGEKSAPGHIGPLWNILRGSSSHGKSRKIVYQALRRRDWKGWFDSRESEDAYWDAVLAHHGSLPARSSFRDSELWREEDGYSPHAALTELSSIMRAMFEMAFDSNFGPLPNASRFLHALAGLIVLADWLGSDSAAFPFPEQGVPTGAARIAWARARAVEILKNRNLNPSDARAQAQAKPVDFPTLFPGSWSPRPAQAALLEAALPKPGQILTLEAETGSGKTEAALLHFFRLFRAGEIDGLYFALPTRTSAVQIHSRVKSIVRRWFGEAAPSVGLAVPGYLRVDDKVGTYLPDSWKVLWPDEPDRDRVWAVENSKSYLSGALMIGTVDQLLLGGLQVKHAQFRSGPMLRLLLIVDEVHASDAYMSKILCNVLNQHCAAGGHALLMSATLGATARVRLLAAGKRIEDRDVPSAEDAMALAYPAVCRAGEVEPKPIALDGREKRIRVDLLEPARFDTVLVEIKAAVEAGAAVLLIRNTVADAQETFCSLESLGVPLLRCRDVATPHHGRYAPDDRKLLDKALEKAFRGNERAGVVAVTTQTAEQSLDICADWLVTDLCPGDVLLQRIGRLHRHKRARPVGFETPKVSVLAPAEMQLADSINPKNGEPRGRVPLGLGRVYRNVLGVIATRKWLTQKEIVRVPQDNREFVERVTNPETLTVLAETLGTPWDAHWRYVQGVMLGEGMTASTVLLNWCESIQKNQYGKDRVIFTRLGLNDRRVELPEPMLGPFGEQITELRLPGWMAGDLPEDVLPDRVVAIDGTIRFRLGEREYCYDRLGLSQAKG